MGFLYVPRLRNCFLQAARLAETLLLPALRFGTQRHSATGERVKLYPSPGKALDGPCDGCGLRRQCAKGFDCKAYRRHTEGESLSRVLQWRGHKLKPQMLGELAHG